MKVRDFFTVAAIGCSGAGLIGFGLKFNTYIAPTFNTEEPFWIFLPPWPNRFDVLFLCAVGVLMLLLSLERFYFSTQKYDTSTGAKP
jgi:hypothetical protein